MEKYSAKKVSKPFNYTFHTSPLKKKRKGNNAFHDFRKHFEQKIQYKKNDINNTKKWMKSKNISDIPKETINLNKRKSVKLDEERNTYKNNINVNNSNINTDDKSLMLKSIKINMKTNKIELDVSKKDKDKKINKNEAPR